MSTWAQTWHIISTCRLQSNAQTVLGLDSDNLFRYQFSAIHNHHCPAPASISTRHQKCSTSYYSSTADTCKEYRFSCRNSISMIRNCKGLRTYFFASCCACLWERHNSSTKIKFWTSSPPWQNVSICALLSPWVAARILLHRPMGLDASCNFWHVGIVNSLIFNWTRTILTKATNLPSLTHFHVQVQHWKVFEPNSLDVHYCSQCWTCS